MSGIGLLHSRQNKYTFVNVGVSEAFWGKPWARTFRGRRMHLVSAERPTLGQTWASDRHHRIPHRVLCIPPRPNLGQLLLTFQICSKHEERSCCVLSCECMPCPLVAN